LHPQRSFHWTHVTDGDRGKVKLSAMFHLDVDVDWKVEVSGRDGVHVEQQATDRSQADDRPPAFLYWTYTVPRHYQSLPISVMSTRPQP